MTATWGTIYARRETLRWQEGKKPGGCVYRCGRAGATKDHILPRCRVRIRLACTVVTVPACDHCNQLRMILGHSPVALMIVRGVAAELYPGIEPRKAELWLVHKWGLLGARAKRRMTTKLVGVMKAIDGRNRGRGRTEAHWDGRP